MLSAALLLGWDALVGYLYPGARNAPVAQPNAPAQQAAATPAPTAHTRTGGLDAQSLAVEKADLRTALAGGNRVPIDAPRLAGSINLANGTIDDLVLKDFRESVKKDSEPVRLFSPAGTPAQEFAEFGFLANGQRLAAGPWQTDGAKLTPATPVTLSRQGAGGLTYRIRFSIDDGYMLRAEQRVDNSGTAPAVVQPYALINRTDRAASQDIWIAQSGPIGVFDGKANYDVDYKDLAEDGPTTPQGKVGWTGFTDIYWLAALVPQSGAQASASYRSLGNSLFRADLIYAPTTLAAGASVSHSTQLFAGAKESTVLDRYEATGIPRFSFAIDWGWFRWFEQPFLWLLRELFHLTGNFGVAIICLTIIVRAALFPIAQKGLRQHGRHEGDPAEDEGNAGQVQRRQGQAAAGNAEAVQGGGGQPARRLPADASPDADPVRTLQGIRARHRYAPPAFRTVDQGFVSARSCHGAEPLRLASIPAAELSCHRRAGAAARRHHVADLQAQSSAGRSGAAADVRDHAVGADVRHGALCRRAAALLDHQQSADHRTATLPLLQASAAARCGQGGARGGQVGRKGVSEGPAADAQAPAERERQAGKLFSGRVDFLLSAPELRFLPEPTVPEIAFCGRSNVGKSSLLNALTGRRSIARASVTPGRTQELNFFEVGTPTAFRLVDMPGYGFAKAPVKVVERWKALVRTYLRGRQVLARVLVLVDARHGLKDVDREMMAMLDAAAVSYRLVLTKADKLKASDLEDVRAKTAAEAKTHVAAFPQIHVTSAEKGLGIGDLRTAVLDDARL